MADPSQSSSSIPNVDQIPKHFSTQIAALNGIYEMLIRLQDLPRLIHEMNTNLMANANQTQNLNALVNLVDEQATDAAATTPPVTANVVITS